MRQFLSRLSIKWIVPPLLVVPVLVVALVLTLLAYKTGRQTADELAGQNMAQIHSRIEEHLTRLLDMPPAILELNKRMLGTGELALGYPDRNRVPVFETLSIFPAVSSIVLGKATGEVMWVIRYPGETTYEYAIKQTPDGRMMEFPLSGQGEIAGDRLSEYDFNATGRPWYRAAIEADGPTWGDIYVWVRGGKGETLGIPYVEPYRDAGGSVIGVVNCELTLADVSAFLGRLEIGKTGKAFIMERDGSLVANSEGIECMNAELDRLPASEAPDLWISAAAGALASRFGLPCAIAEPHRLSATIAGRPARIGVSPYRNRRDLEWLIVTLVPDADFLAVVEQNRMRGISLGVVAVVLMLGVSAVTVVKITRPILSLVSHARRIGDGHLDDRIELDDNLEMVQLSSAINKMVDDVQQRDLLANTIESLAHPFYVVDAEDYSILIKNAAAEALSKSDAATCYALTHRSDAPCGGDEHPCPLEMVKATGKPAIVEHIHHDADGNEFFAEVHGYPVFDAEGNVVQMIEYSLDITERRKAEQELRKLSSAVRQSPATVVITDVLGHIEYANPKFAETTGYTVEEALGQNPRVLKSGEHPSEFYKDLWDTINSGEEWHGEFYNRRKDGSLYWESASISPITDSSGTIANFVAVKEDVTERKRTEDALRTALQLGRLVDEVGPDEVMQACLDETERLTGSSIGFFHLVHEASGELRLVAWSKQTRGHCAVPPADERTYPISEGGVWLDCLRERKPVIHNDYASLPQCKGLPDGHVQVVREATVPIFDGDRIVAVMGVGNKLSDYDEKDIDLITLLAKSTWVLVQRKRMQEELLSARIAADSANQAKSEFLSSMSHELRTPLNGVLGYVQVLQRDRTLNLQQRKSLESIKNCGEHLLALINDVLDLSKIEAGRMEIEPAPCDFSHLITSVADIIRQRAEGRGLELLVDVEPQVPRGIMADEKKLRQVLVNLLGNAVKFTQSGHIGLSVSEEQGETITLKVSDTGMGISEDHIESIFDPFAQSEGGKTAGGTGLGLAISVRMVEGMGGTLSVESELGVGSTFTVVLPLSEVDDRELAAVESPGLGGDNPDLVLAPDQDVLALVADDREANRDVLVQLMAAAGFRTVQAANGREALDMMREHRPQVVLMDVRMPEMDGVTAVGIIREDADLKDTCVIAVSASVFPDSAQRFRDAGFDDFIGKPLAAGELFRKLGEHAGVQYVDLGGTEEDDGAEATGTTVLTTEEAEGIASRIRSAVEVGDVAALTALAAELESSGGPASAYAGRIADLVGMFDFTGLSALADEIESAPPSEP